MSGCSYSEKCPKCGGEMTCYSDWKPHDMVSGVCMECVVILKDSVNIIITPDRHSCDIAGRKAHWKCDYQKHKIYGNLFFIHLALSPPGKC